MQGKYPRKPIGNFFVKKDLQIRLIVKIVMSVLLATGIFAITMIITYNTIYEDAAFYQVTLNSEEPQIGDRLEIITILLPSIVISTLINVLLAAAIGLYASRKYAVPVFKLEKWASLIAEGKLTAVLRFREKDEMKELSDKCNKSTEKIRSDLLVIKHNAEILRQNPETPGLAENILETLKNLELEPNPLVVGTASIEYSNAAK